MDSLGPQIPLASSICADAIANDGDSLIRGIDKGSIPTGPSESTAYRGDEPLVQNCQIGSISVTSADHIDPLCEEGIGSVSLDSSVTTSPKSHDVGSASVLPTDASNEMPTKPKKPLLSPLPPIDPENPGDRRVIAPHPLHVLVELVRRIARYSRRLLTRSGTLNAHSLALMVDCISQFNYLTLMHLYMSDPDATELPAPLLLPFPATDAATVQRLHEEYVARYSTLTGLLMSLYHSHGGVRLYHKRLQVYTLEQMASFEASALHRAYAPYIRHSYCPSHQEPVPTAPVPSGRCTARARRAAPAARGRGKGKGKSAMDTQETRAWPSFLKPHVALVSNAAEANARAPTPAASRASVGVRHRDELHVRQAVGRMAKVQALAYVRAEPRVAADEESQRAATGPQDGVATSLDALDAALAAELQQDHMSPEDVARCERAAAALAAALEKFTCGEYTVVPCGSVASGLAAPGSDLDMGIARLGPPLPPPAADALVVEDVPRGVTALSRDRRLLLPSSAEEKAAAVSLLARVQEWLPATTAVVSLCVDAQRNIPLAKLRFEEALEVDMGLLEPNNHHNPRLVSAFAAHCPFFLPLARMVKLWAKRRGVVDASAHFLNSWTLVLLVAQYLQLIGLLPVVHASSPECPLHTRPNLHPTHARSSLRQQVLPLSAAHAPVGVDGAALDALVQRLDASTVEAAVEAARLDEARVAANAGAGQSRGDEDEGEGEGEGVAEIDEDGNEVDAKAEEEESERDAKAGDDEDADADGEGDGDGEDAELSDAMAALRLSATGDGPASAEVCLEAAEVVHEHGLLRVGPCDHRRLHTLPPHLHTTLLVAPLPPSSPGPAAAADVASTRAISADELSAAPTAAAIATGSPPSLAQLFCGFFAFYAFVFDPALCAVSVRRGRLLWLHELQHLYLTKRGSLRAPWMAVEEPFNTHRNTARALNKERLLAVQTEWRRAALLLAVGAPLAHVMEPWSTSCRVLADTLINGPHALASTLRDGGAVPPATVPAPLPVHATQAEAETAALALSGYTSLIAGCLASARTVKAMVGVGRELLSHHRAAAATTPAPTTAAVAVATSAEAEAPSRRCDATSGATEDADSAVEAASTVPLLYDTCVPLAAWLETAAAAQQRATDRLCETLRLRLHALADTHTGPSARVAPAHLTTLLRVLYCGAAAAACRYGPLFGTTASSEAMLAVRQWWWKHTAGPSAATASGDVYCAREFFEKIAADREHVSQELSAAAAAVVAVGAEIH